MTNAYSPPTQPIRLHPANDPTPDPNAFVSLLHSIGAGAASNGRPWPEGHLPQGRRMALSDADCSLNGLRVVMEILLAAERSRQNGAPDQYVGDRVLEGLVMAGLGLTAHASGRLLPEG
ncbi:hypothetical protein Q2B95_14920 [Stenotrophomonas maltophilia]|uniref:hypothetical protein n=1 Tax=Stenotrophomonas maltophilia TaxID=40324 RepID=UPI0021C8B0F1|nr:hypothetical protein [Stenotrophomonas maltophilia]MCU1020174.1 hypothetical protein [Stenotrophomonas maltophilia]HEL5052265.1 hypothetical protein [Stenotrophomonas maltophilia]